MVFGRSSVMLSSTFSFSLPNGCDSKRTSISCLPMGRGSMAATISSVRRNGKSSGWVISWAGVSVVPSSKRTKIESAGTSKPSNLRPVRPLKVASLSRFLTENWTPSSVLRRLPKVCNCFSSKLGIANAMTASFGVTRYE